MSLVLNNWAQAKIILTTVRQSVSKSRLILSLFPFQVFVETTFGPSTTSPITTVTAVHGKYLRIQHLVYGFRVNYSRTSMARTRAREIDKCKSVQPFHKQSAISVSFTVTTDRPFPRSWKLPIGSFRNDRPFPNIR